MKEQKNKVKEQAALQNEWITSVETKNWNWN